MNLVERYNAMMTNVANLIVKEVVCPPCIGVQFRTPELAATLRPEVEKMRHHIITHLGQEFYDRWYKWVE